MDICDIHRHLSDTIFLDKPTDGLGAFQCTRLHDDVAVGITLRSTCNGVALTDGASLLTDIEGNGIGPTGGGGIEVIVNSNEEVAGSNHRTSGTSHILVERASAKVGSLLRVGDALGNTLVLTPATDGQVLALRLEGRSLVAIAGNTQLRSNALCQLTGQDRTLL